MVNKNCTCGEWQEHGIPCVDAMAYCRHEEETTFDDVLVRHVSNQYTYENAQELLALNLVPVCMDSVTPDGATLPPRMSLKRTSGRPNKLRLKKRSCFAENPEESNVVCSKCKERGHNVRTSELAI